MRITKVNIPKSIETNDGLDPIKMDKLGPIVLIAGKNGSGKTRILNKIISTLSTKPRINAVENAKIRLKQFHQNLIAYSQDLNNLQQQLTVSKDPNSIANINQNITSHTSAIDSFKAEIIRLEGEINWSIIETTEISKNYLCVPFVPKSLALMDCNNYQKRQILSAASNIDTVGVASLPDGAFAKIQVIQDRFREATHPHSDLPEEEKQTAIKEYDKLNKLVEIFLNTSVGRTLNGEATLFGFPMGKANLSDGQKILLQFCLAIYSQETALKDLILILDEPENHLHPSVIIETLDRIQKCNSNGQIWIATHSIPLLAHFDPSLIWYVENNKIGHAGKIPEKVLNSLLGDDNEVARLQDFISLPSQYASSRFAFESLFEPQAILTESSDPQSFQIRTDLLKLTSNGKLRLLDYGSGKGRLISNIVDLDENTQVKLIESIDYIAYDKFPTDKEHCEAALNKAYGNCDKRYFNDFNNLLSVYDKGSFDVVIMCNVLHEIDPKHWLKLFQNDGLISSLLSTKGILLLVEDHQMPIGEKAYQKGFLVLDTPQLKELFKITEKDTDFTFTDQKGDGRLKAHQVPKHCLIQIDETSKLAALKSLSVNAREKILEIREKEKNYQNGKLHGFWTQQFANAQLNISELSSN